MICLCEKATKRGLGESAIGWSGVSRSHHSRETSVSQTDGDSDMVAASI